MTTVREWLEKASRKIRILEAEEMIMEILGMEAHVDLVRKENLELTDEQLRTLDGYLLRRTLKEPLAYILGTKNFFGLDIKVDGRALIPRPESEEIMEFLQDLGRVDRILDVGTGSGCLALGARSLYLGRKNDILATDISELALSLARENSEALSLPMEFKKADLLEGCEEFLTEGRCVIMANLPYVDRTWSWLDRKALGYEPSLALYAENKGLAVVYRFLDELSKAKEKLSPAVEELYLLLETDPIQHESVEKKLAGYGMEIEKMGHFASQVRVI